MLAHEVRSARVATLVGQVAGHMLAAGITPRNIVRSANEVIQALETSEEFARTEFEKEFVSGGRGNAWPR